MLATHLPMVPPVPSHSTNNGFMMHDQWSATAYSHGQGHQGQMYHPQYPSFTQSAQSPPKQYAGQGTSSAFSASANPDEDWTKISDLAERRRIQNRIAQRNYRKKLKRRLEDLERRAASPENESEKASSPPPATTKTTKSKKQSSSKAAAAKPSQPAYSSAVKPVSAMQYSPPLSNNDDFMMSYGARDGSHTPPLYYSTTHYPPPDESIVPCANNQPYHMEPYPSYLAHSSAMASTIPSVDHFSEAFKNEPYSNDAVTTQYAHYDFIPGMDMNGASPYESNPVTPPLFHSFDHSANVSEAGNDYPATPLSLAESPNMNFS